MPRSSSALDGGRTRRAATRLLRGAPSVSPALLIVGLLACILIPLPTVLVDLFLSLSLALAVLLLVASLRVPRSSEFLSFPTLLLFVTLFRLALNVSTTRLILAQADAGRVVDAFANFVVRGDLIIGAVMFVIITVIQYVVIARGSERVAEVGARFALDSMPGHQAAIDADLRAGAISPHEAALRRSRLTERSNFHGAMDGAIRFVKGDAVAGLVITAINLVGGLAIGMGRNDLGWQASLELYGRLTIGDGLVAQIPALLVSLAAGILVSRVDTEDGRGLRRWLEPAMLLVPALLLGLLAAVPNMPHVAFATTAIVLVAAAVALSARREELPPAAVGPESISICVDEAKIPQLGRHRRALEVLRRRCADALGIDVPPLELARVPAMSGTMEVRFGARLLARVPLDDDVESSLVLGGFRAVMGHAEDLVDLQDVDGWIERERARKPAVVRRALEKVGPEELLGVVRAFLRERIPVPPFDALLGVFADGSVVLPPTERHLWPERVRQRLAKYWADDLLEGLTRLGPTHCVRPTPDLELELLDHQRFEGERCIVALTPAQRRQWIEHLLSTPRASTDGPREIGATLVLVTAKARPAFATLFAGQSPHVPVISVDELVGGEVPGRIQVRWVDLPVER